MSIHPIPAGIDPILLERAIQLRLLRLSGFIFIYDNGIGQNPTALEFIPDLDTTEEPYLQKVFEYAAHFSTFENLPDWANWTGVQAENHIQNVILNGKTLAQLEQDIDGLPATVEGMKMGLKQVAATLVDIRSMLKKIAKAVIYIRNLVLRLN